MQTSFNRNVRQMYCKRSESVSGVMAVLSIRFLSSVLIFTSGYDILCVICCDFNHLILPLSNVIGLNWGLIFNFYLQYMLLLYQPYFGIHIYAIHWSSHPVLMVYSVLMAISVPIIPCRRLPRIKQCWIWPLMILLGFFIISQFF